MRKLNLILIVLALLCADECDNADHAECDRDENYGHADGREVERRGCAARRRVGKRRHREENCCQHQAYCDPSGVRNRLAEILAMFHTLSTFPCNSHTFSILYHTLPLLSTDFLKNFDGWKWEKTLEGEGTPFRVGVNAATVASRRLLPPNHPHPPRTFLSRVLCRGPLNLPCCAARRGAVEERGTKPGSGKFFGGFGWFGIWGKSGYRTPAVGGTLFLPGGQKFAVHRLAGLGCAADDVGLSKQLATI